MSEEVVLVTGGSRGIGKSIVETYLKAGGYAVYGTATSNSGKRKIESLVHHGWMREKQIIPHCNVGTNSPVCFGCLIMFQISFGRLCLR